MFIPMNASVMCLQDQAAVVPPGCYKNNSAVVRSVHFKVIKSIFYLTCKHTSLSTEKVPTVFPRNLNEPYVRMFRSDARFSVQALWAE